MKDRSWPWLLAAVLVAGGYLGYRFARPPSPVPEAPEERPDDRTDRPARRAPTPTTGSRLLSDLGSASPAQDAERIRRTAEEMRARCRTDKDFMRGLISLLQDPAQPEHVRETIAFVLGSLTDPEAQQALVRALERGGDPAWIRTLVLALGSARDRGREGSFSLPEGPWVRATGSGLSVEIRAILLDPAARSAVRKQFEHVDAEVRRAAVQALQHTLIFEARSRREGDAHDIADLREAFLRQMDQDPDESIRAESSRALAEWIATAPEGSSDHDRAVGRVLAKSLEAEEDQVRFRALPGLKQSRLKEGLTGVVDAALGGSDFERRAWAIELAASRSEELDSESRESIRKLALTDPDPKIREIALAQMPEETVARRALKDSEWNVRYAAVRALGESQPGPESREALEEVRRSDDREEVRRAAEQALLRIAPR